MQHIAHDLPARYLRAQEAAQSLTRHLSVSAGGERVGGTVDPRKLPAPASALQLITELAALGDTAGSGMLAPALDRHLDHGMVLAASAALRVRKRGTDLRQTIATRYPRLPEASLRLLTRAEWMRAQGTLSDLVLDAILASIEAEIDAVSSGRAEHKKEDGA
ncbi:hypothetical protein [uncultured Microbacterium sp.]|uniref:hypothetical protein n=1 Tax=uncultured Microbacterium sp. TaxID=191216 RepID=UPI0028DB0667|nr:hypothetical protein [uncultured Microbacterium sp.]